MITSKDFKKVLIKNLNLGNITVDDINDTDVLFGDEGLGLDSVDSVELGLVIEKEYGIRVPNTIIRKRVFASVENLLNHINENIK